MLSKTTQKRIEQNLSNLTKYAEKQYHEILVEKAENMTPQEFGQLQTQRGDVADALQAIQLFFLGKKARLGGVTDEK